jgi:hypothetical protein
MITSFLQGGLGNQMFQIMAAYSLSREVNEDLYFDFDKCFTPNQGFTSSRYVKNLFKNLKKDDNSKHNHKIYRQNGFDYKEIPKEKNLLLIGDFQSEKYFEKYKNEIGGVFNLDENKMSYMKDYVSKLSNNQKMTSIHVRRGDYLTKPNYHPTQSIEYYKTSIDLIGDSNFIFISDDIKWCKENIYGENIFYSEFTNEIDDLYLMMMCDNNILSNSSFSWWGSYLSPYQNKIIAPKLWFGVDGPQDTQDIYNKNWIII